MDQTPSPTHTTRNETRAPTLRLIDGVALCTLLLIVGWWWLVLAIQGSPSDWAFDFRQFWQGGRDVVDGISPYPSAADLEAASTRLDAEGIRTVFRFPYPAGAAILFAPFGLLGFHAAAAVWSAALIASLLVGMWILGVRDWRVLGVVVTSAPVISAVRLGTLTPLLILLLAITWRARERPWVAGSSLAVAIALKLFLLPLVVWLLATGRRGAALVTMLLALALTFVGWSVIGFAGLSTYPELVRKLADVVSERGFSLVALGMQSGLTPRMAEILAVLVGLALLGIAVATGRSGTGDRSSFVFALVAALALTPIAWLHYFALLVVPLALWYPRMFWPWAMLWLFWFIPGQENEGDAWRILFGIAIVIGVVTATTARRGHDESWTLR